MRAHSPTLLSLPIFSLLSLLSLSCNNPIDGGEPDDNIDIPGLIDLRVEPADATMQVTPGSMVEQGYRVIGRFAEGDRDLTERSVLDVADHDLGSFTGTVFRASAARGGLTRVIANLNGTGKSAATGLTVKMSAVLAGPDNGMALPPDAAGRFGGADNMARAPRLVYPTSGTLMPPNLSRLEIHYLPGSAQNRLFEVSFQSATGDIRVYQRCPEPTNGGCIYTLDTTAYRYVAASNRGGEALRVQVRGTDDQGSAVGTSAPITLQFSESNVEGALYYWTTSNDTAIMRFDFGGASTQPEVFLAPGKSGLPTCIGCHALSRDGKKMVSSLGGQNDGRIVYLADLSRPTQFALKGDTDHRIQFASFSPTGDRFAAIYGDTDGALRNRLWFHDGETGRRLPAESIDLPFEPDHPDWAPNGQLIAVDRVGIHNTSQRPQHCGIELLTRANNGWGAPQTLVATAAGRNRYNPNFAPDSSLLLFSESVCPGGDVKSDGCDGDADNPAKTWAVAARTGATPVLMARAGAPGALDAGPDLADTFPRFSPFQQQQRGGRLFWVTISSRRRLGLRDPGGRQLLWMFAIDPDQVMAGKDGSAAAFFLPFQDLNTSNHIGQWTTKIVPPLG